MSGGSASGLFFKSADSKLYAGSGATKSNSGISVVPDVWYLIDLRDNNNSGTNHIVDLRVNGTAVDQVSADATIPGATMSLGVDGSVTASVVYDDLVVSVTQDDYPIGAGYVNHFVPTADGTHNVAGANDFERSTGGVDITNATTDAYLLIDDVPLKATSPTEFVNMVAPPNATDYTEHIFGPASGISTPTAGPRAVEVIALVAQTGTGAGNMELRLNDNGTTGVIYTATAVAGIIAGKYVRAHFADPPSAASTWTVVAGNGNFNDVRVRFGSPAAVDANPDQYLASIMIEAEFAAVSPPVGKLLRVNQSVNRSATY